MVLASAPGFLHIPILTPETMTHTTAAILTTDMEQEDTLALMELHLGPKLVLPEFWANRFPRCGVLISSAICGGELRTRLRNATEAYPHRCWLLAEPQPVEFPLPCPDGCGRPAAQPTGPSFYSQALCCQYTHFFRNHQGYFTLWDTEQTLAQKIALAKELGFLGYAGPV